ncbi:D-alanyl-D-alanine carboxypeptidase [Amycolatopsis antarctica]|uniref:D-alanyl-D-alanine carboxypeptidase n=1 Tax=Amycolatopsis antarctica TaxID=1854586 RepID=A0A263CY54_9PSEU|nr:D-alanyl-D-alanine carboxypeptidase family protein [Amycolatopsis antarctica]OZM71084.1 D-alanyl-D-alanine carboxypeptidase [Amycolatopsis antarctica]
MIVSDTSRDRIFAILTRFLALALLPFAFVCAPGRARFLACQWALGLRFPDEDLAGLTATTRDALTAARAVAFWRDRRLIGVTSGHRDHARQRELFAEEVARLGSPHAARTRVLPAEESAHVKGIAVDVRPVEGARWLEDHGAAYGLYRTYRNEWWHFEYRTSRPEQRPHPGARLALVLS